MTHDAVDLLVRGADWVVPVSGPDVRGGWVACTEGVVVAVGGPGDEPDATSVLDATGAIVTPGLVNAHHHLFQSLTRAHAPSAGLGLGDWLGALRPLWSRLDPDAAYVAAWVGLADLALAGCTTTADHQYLHPTTGLVEATLRAAADIGLRLDPCRGFVDASVFATPGAEDAETVLAESQALLAEWHDPSPSSRCRVSLGPTALTATSTALLGDVAVLAAKHDARLHVHLFEEAEETERSLAGHGKAPVQLLADAGWSERSWIAHGNHTSPSDIRALRDAGIGVAHCPSSNAFLGGPAAPLAAWLDEGVTVGLGTDGNASAGTSQLWLEARTAVLHARQRGGAAALTSRQALELATVGSAACLGRAGEVGALAPGLQADLAVWDTSGPSYAGAVTDPVEAWLRCGPPRVRHTVVAGRPVVADGRLTAPGLDDLLTRHRRIAEDWQATPTIS